MYRLAVLVFVIASASCQQESSKRVPKYAGDPRTAAIVQEARYLNGNGAFGAAYQQEDGIDFKEETDAEGNRKGSYSYIDPTGQRKTVNYIAGKNGFQAIGDHIPTAPQSAAPTPGYTPDPRYQAPQQPQYSAPQQPQYAPQQPQYAPQPQQRYTITPSAPRNYAKPNEDDGQYHPELYEQENYVAPTEQRNYAPQPQYQQAAYTSNAIYPGVQQAQYSGIQNQQYTAPIQPAVRQFYDHSTTTPQPTRFFPPGQFSLNRSPDGYTYSFHKV